MKKTLLIILVMALVLSAAACGNKPVAPAQEPASEAAPVQPKEEAALSIADIAEGTYTGTLSGDSYSTSDDESTYTISPNISPAELTIIIKDGNVRLYCAAVIKADGTILGVATPRSPAYTKTASGILPLKQTDSDTVCAEGELAALGEKPWIYWDDNKTFTNWEIKKVESDTYTCSVSIALSNGVPTAEITVSGSKSKRTATVPLRNAKDAETSYVLWSNVGAEGLQSSAVDYYVAFILQDCTVTELETCHYSSGGKEPGQLMLFGEDGSEFGPFQAVGREGPDGTANAYWVAAVSIDIPAGRYAVADSDQSTWSSSGETDGWGMATIRGRVK